MKTRQGFVSNSSSSSFVLLGKKITIKELEKLVNFDSYKRDEITIKCIGKYLSEGYDIFDLTEEMYQFVMTHEISDQLTFVNSFYYASTDNTETIKKSQILEEEFQIFSGEEDYHFTNTLNDFIDYYEDKD